MDDALLTLAQWLSPAFPVGGFAYSHGLEWAIAAGDVTDAGGVEAWLADVLRLGAGFTDAALIAAAMSDDVDPAGLDVWARALAPSAERWAETRDQGAAFTAAVNAVCDTADPPAALPVAVGRAARRLDLPPETVAAHYLQAFASNLTLAAVRFVPLGAGEGQRIIAKLRPVLREVAAQATRILPQDVGTAALGAEFAAMKHETMETRVFRT